MTWTAPRTWVAAEIPTASILNTHLRDNLKAIGDAWTAYTPTWTVVTGTNPTNYTGTGGYVQAGKLVVFKARVAAAASFTAGSGSYRVSLPASILDAIGARFVVTVFDASTSNTFFGETYSVSGTQAPVGYNDGSSVLAAVTNAAPIVFTTSDYIELTGTYEAA